MMVGLFGAGKTTTIAKLAKYYSKRNYKVATVGLDVHRPAAPEQLQQLSKQINIPCFINKEEKDPIKIYKQFNKIGIRGLWKNIKNIKKSIILIINLLKKLLG